MKKHLKRNEKSLLSRRARLTRGSREAPDSGLAFTWAWQSLKDTHIFVWDNLHVLYMSRSLKNLSKDFFCNSRIQSTNVQSTLVWLWSRTTNHSSRARGRHNGPRLTRHWRSQCCRNRIVVLRDDNGCEGRRRHMRWITLAVSLGAVVMLLTRCISRRRWWR